MTYLLFLIFFWGLPIFICAKLCRVRNRSEAKGVFLGLCFGWLAAIGLWLGLKRRHPTSLYLY